MIVAFDIDHLKVVEDELQQRVRELSRLNERLNREVEIRKKIEANLQDYTTELKLKNQELEQFAYVASHDLQEPLRMISSFTQLLGRKYRGNLDKEAEEYIAFTIEGATRMQQLINDLLAYSRIGTRGKEFKTINFEEIIQKAIYNLSLTIQETGAEIKFGPMPTITGDDSQLVQLIQNLISNAIKFRKEGITPVINITAKKEPSHYIFTVADNGIGIAMEHKERIFQIFQRLHTRDKYPGTGIGLAICKKIVERHNGEIWVESEKGMGGTRFYFTIKK
jgi:light-regulated signal transduction histidine kinase (bacteriophytochrome)